MAYQKGYVVSIIPQKTNKPVREHAENGERVCRLDFDSEYKIRLKNTTGKPAFASISIDGTPISTAGELIVLPNSSIDVERFVDDLKSGQKFKFVRKDHSEIQDPAISELGLVEVRFTPARNTSFDFLYHNNMSNGILRSRGGSWSSGVEGSATFTNCVSNNLNISSVVEASNTSVGGTVAGSTSLQQFTAANNFAADGDPEFVKIRLRGTQAEAVVPNILDRYKVLMDGKEVAGGYFKEVRVNGHLLEAHFVVPIGHVNISVPV